ncbi:MAG: hypothetical protein OXH98_02235, partial [Caldilineaceae bacterium]|nr:hypothetical protein [Caldilineaceae bacterium]
TPFLTNPSFLTPLSLSSYANSLKSLFKILACNPDNLDFFNLGAKVMARRPVFVPVLRESRLAESIDIEFNWFPGFSKKQVQKTIESMHEAAARLGISPVLEVSRKSRSSLGASLSAFDLLLKSPFGQEISVECAYQGSKVFEKGGPFHDLYLATSREAKTDERLRNSGEVTAFDYFGIEFPIEPQTAFYDWLYMTALSHRSARIVEELRPYKGFSDIAFNPKSSINCQARAAASFVSLSRLEPNPEDLLGDWASYLKMVTEEEAPSTNTTPARQLSILTEDTQGSAAPHCGKGESAEGCNN